MVFRPPRKLPKNRARFIMMVLIIGFGLILARDGYIQIIKRYTLQVQGRMRYFRTVDMPGERGLVLARNGQPLAVNIPAATIWANPSTLRKSPQSWKTIENILGLSSGMLQKRLNNGGSNFSYLMRQISPSIAKAIKQAHISGIHTRETSRTYYPMGAMATSIVGLVNILHQGSSGLERSYNAWLTSHTGKKTVLIDGHGQIVRVVKNLQLAQSGHNLRLTINPQIQYWAYTSLLASLHRFHATDGSAVVMNVQNGQILAMASVPSCNANSLYACANPADYSNNAVHQAFEPGSVMKPFVVAAALASHSVSPNARFDVYHPLMLDGFRITDGVPHHVLNIEHILKFYSDIGASKISLKTPKQTIYNMYSALGFGSMADIGFLDATSGILPPWQNWSRARHATIAIGYGITVTTLQLADAYAAIANGGYHIRPDIIMGQKLIKRRVMPAWVSKNFACGYKVLLSQMVQGS